MFSFRGRPERRESGERKRKRKEEKKRKEKSRMDDELRGTTFIPYVQSTLESFSQERANSMDAQSAVGLFFFFPFLLS